VSSPGLDLARPVRVAAVQLEVALGDVERNLAECERLAREAARGGARIVALPEFFTTGAAFLPEVAGGALPPDGAAAQLLRGVAAQERIWIGGSFLCRDDDGHVRNAYLLAGPDGEIAGRHDKDLPTMWENALYVGGDDDGVIEADGFSAGAAVCWELMRSQTARRLRGRVDVVIGGSNWWSIPPWPPRAVTRRMERRNGANALRAPAVFGRYVGAPVIHAANCGRVRCPMPELPPLAYDGRFEGGVLIADAAGNVLARRTAGEGAGLATADVRLGRTTPAEPVPSRFWLHRRGAIPVYAWHAHRLAGRRWYRAHVGPAARVTAT
jgi:predicted amidohydrolase